jgi:hypothetical protein
VHALGPPARVPSLSDAHGRAEQVAPRATASDMRRPTALLLALAAATVAAAAAPPPKVCRVSEHVADPSAATAGIQATFDACAVGGTILFDIPGVAYTSGAVVLTGRDLHVVIPPGVALQASTRREDYPGPQSEWYLLHFRNCTGCSLSGGGAVDGRARAWIVGRRPAARDEDSVKVFRQFDFADPTARCYKPTECRPRLVGVRHSDGVTISGVSLLDPASPAASSSCQSKQKTANRPTKSLTDTCRNENRRCIGAYTSRARAT